MNIAGHRLGRTFGDLRRLTSLGIAFGIAFAVAERATAIPTHNHGSDAVEDWTSWERDGNFGGVESHDHNGAIEAGDESHQHYIAEDFGGDNNTAAEPFSAFGVWDNETAHIDRSDPFDNDRYPPAPHGFIEVGHEPDYYFKGDWSSAAATNAKAMIKELFGVWSSISAVESPVTGQFLETGIGFKYTETVGIAEIIIEWRDIADGDGGGHVTDIADGQHTSANPVKIEFDSSYSWEFTRGGEPDDTNWDFYSVAFHEICHVMFLEHQVDQDLKDAPVGQPKNPQDPDGLFHWDGFVDNPGDNDYFTGKHWQFVGGSWQSTDLQDKDTVDGVKSLYSIPVEPEDGPAVSQWGMAVIVLLLLSGIAIKFGRRWATNPA